MPTRHGRTGHAGRLAPFVVGLVAIEYALIVSVIALFLVPVLQQLGDTLLGLYGQIDDALQALTY
ncbi:MAG: Flp family type IVb pilin [Nevskiales bacterium]|nr:Flp family type IVb pilin [Nevskiales bacterium]